MFTSVCKEKNVFLQVYQGYLNFADAFIQLRQDATAQLKVLLIQKWPNSGSLEMQVVELATF